MASGAIGYSLHAWSPFENSTIDARFALRGSEPADDVAIVDIDEKTFSELKLQWPFPRSDHGELIRRLHEDGARVIVYDVQFTEPSRDPREDLALYEAARQAGNVVFATTEVNEDGEAGVLGGEQNLKRIGALVAASNLPADTGGVIRRYPYTMLGLPSLAVAAARADGHSVASTRFDGDRALIDFRGPPNTLVHSSFIDVLDGRAKPGKFAGKVVVVGASTPTLQDLHQVSTTGSTPMAGPELQASAIWTALHDNPLQPAPTWLAWLAIVLGGLLAPLASLSLRVLASAALALLAVAAYALLAQLAFDSGVLLVFTYPIMACAVGMVGALAANYLGAFVERNGFLRQLHDSQIEMIDRLASAVESRDLETGAHIRRIGLLCERVALELGWSATDAEMLRHASAMHDIGKIGIPDRVLLKAGKLDEQEWEIIRAHTTTGGDILADSQNPHVQMAEQIARHHHERWDGTGYPDRLAGEQIPLPARICAVCDVYDALLSKRSYKEAWSLKQALEELRQGSRAHFDPAIVEAFLRIAGTITQELEDPSPAFAAAKGEAGAVVGASAPAS